MGALVATDYKQPKQVIESLEVDKPVRLGGVFDEENGTRPQAGSVYDKESISPTLDTAQSGWRTPLIYEDATDKNDMLKFEGGIGEKKWLDDGKDFSRNYPQGNRVYNANGISCTQTSQGGGLGSYTGLYLVEDDLPICVASRGRNPENPSDRTTGCPTEQRLEPNTQGTTNTITTVQKDNYILEKPFRIRKLTPFECLSLMGLKPHEIEKINKANISDTQKYKMAGNSIVVNVLEHIFANLFGIERN